MIDDYLSDRWVIYEDDKWSLKEKMTCCQCCNRYAKANNPYMDVYDENQDINYLVYFDANNLYGWAMTQPLPYCGFELVTNVTIISILIFLIILLFVKFLKLIKIIWKKFMIHITT